MAINKIRVHSKTEYVIEVNDRGETISFDLEDTGITSKLFKMYEALDKLKDKYLTQAQELDKRPDEPYKTLDEESPIDGTTVQKVLITKNQYEGTQMIDQFYSDARHALDQFLGDGACQKIFGATNYKTMFEDLLEQLAPEFKKMGINTDLIKASAAKKHGPKANKYRTLT